MPERLINSVDYILNPGDTPLPKTPERLITPKDYVGTIFLDFKYMHSMHFTNR